MFEKEAEEYADKDFALYEPTDHERFTKENDWRNGAEFGYNKAKEELQEQGLALQSDMDKTIEQNIQLKKQIDKMKCCFNCRHSRTECEHCKTDKHEKWEIKEK